MLVVCDMHIVHYFEGIAVQVNNKKGRHASPPYQAADIPAWPVRDYCRVKVVEVATPSQLPLTLVVVTV